MSTAQKFKISMFGFDKKQVYDYIDLLITDINSRESGLVKNLKQQLEEAKNQNVDTDSIAKEISAKKDAEYRERIRDYEEKLESYRLEIETRPDGFDPSRMSLTDEEKERMLGRILLDAQKLADTIKNRAEEEALQIKARAEVDARHKAEVIVREAQERLAVLDQEIHAKEEECHAIDMKVSELRSSIIDLASSVLPEGAKGDEAGKARDKTVALRFFQ